MEKEKQERIDELNKKLQEHWKNTAEETKRTHTGKIYEKYMKEQNKSGLKNDD